MLSKQNAMRDFLLASLDDTLRALEDNGEYCRLSARIENSKPSIALDDLYTARHSIELDAVYRAGFRDSARLLMGLLCAP